MDNYLTKAQMKIYFGWTQGSDMLGVYVHLSGKDVDDVLKANEVSEKDTLTINSVQKGRTKEKVKRLHLCAHYN